MFDRIIYEFLYWINGVSTKITSWSWCKLYSNRKKKEKVMATEKKDRPWDGKSRPSDDNYRKRWNDIFGKDKDKFNKVTTRTTGP